MCAWRGGRGEGLGSVSQGGRYLLPKKKKASNHRCRTLAPNPHPEDSPHSFPHLLKNKRLAWARDKPPPTQCKLNNQTWTDPAPQWCPEEAYREVTTEKMTRPPSTKGANLLSGASLCHERPTRQHLLRLLPHHNQPWQTSRKSLDTVT